MHRPKKYAKPPLAIGHSSQVLIQAKSVYLEVNRDLACKATVAMLLGYLATNAAQSGSVCVDDLELPVHLALALDGLLDLRVCQNLIVQTSSIAVHLLHDIASVKATAQHAHYMCDVQMLQALLSSPCDPGGLLTV